MADGSIVFRVAFGTVLLLTRQTRNYFPSRRISNSSTLKTERENEARWLRAAEKRVRRSRSATLSSLIPWAKSAKMSLKSNKCQRSISLQIFDGQQSGPKYPLKISGNWREKVAL